MLQQVVHVIPLLSGFLRKDKEKDDKDRNLPYYLLNLIIKYLKLNINHHEANLCKRVMVAYLHERPVSVKKVYDRNRK